MSNLSRRNAFSVNGQDTIVPKQSLPSGVVMGQRTALSPGDLAGVATMYPGAATFKEVPKDPIIDTTLKEASKEPTADTVKEVRKDPITDTVKEVTKEPTRDTLKEVRKDPVTETVKEVSKEPTRDTIKEVAKDPIRDTTIKEASLDPGPVIGPVQPGPLMPGPAHVSPFVLAMPSRAGFGGTGDPVADATAQVQQLEEAIAQNEQQLAQLLQAYEQAVQTLHALQGGQG